MLLGCVNIQIFFLFWYVKGNVYLKACTGNITLSEYFSQYAYILSLMLRTILYAFVNISSIPVVGNDC